MPIDKYGTLLLLTLLFFPIVYIASTLILKKWAIILFFLYALILVENRNSRDLFAFV